MSSQKLLRKSCANLNQILCFETHLKPHLQNSLILHLWLPVSHCKGYRDSVLPTAVSKKLSFALPTGYFGGILKEPAFDDLGGPIKIWSTWKQHAFLRRFKPPALGLSNGDGEVSSDWVWALIVLLFHQTLPMLSLVWEYLGIRNSLKIHWLIRFETLLFSVEIYIITVSTFVLISSVCVCKRKLTGMKMGVILHV